MDIVGCGRNGVRTGSSLGGRDCRFVIRVGGNIAVDVLVRIFR